MASARLEYYKFPAALPIVEMSSIKLDLYRRDFTINTLAIQLNSEKFGLLIDFFSARRDVKEKIIRVLHNFEPPATDDETAAAALQYVRKVSGATRPSAANQEVFDRAVAEIAEITRRLVREELVSRSAPRSREKMAEQARERGRKRDARMRAKVLAELESGAG